MKTLLFVILLILSLVAQENNSLIYGEQDSGVYETNENLTTLKDIQEAEYIKNIEQERIKKIKKEEEKKLALEVQKIQKSKKDEEARKQKIEAEKKKLEKNFYTKKEVDSLLKKTKEQVIAKTQESINKESDEIVFVKPRTDILVQEDTLITKIVLPFIKFEFNDNKIIIYSDYEMFRNFSIDSSKTLAFDFKAKLSFDLQKGNLESENFKYFAVGNHKDFFRIALRGLKNPSEYSIDYKDKILTITYEKTPK